MTRQTAGVPKPMKQGNNKQHVFRVMGNRAFLPHLIKAQLRELLDDAKQCSTRRVQAAWVGDTVYYLGAASLNVIHRQVLRDNLQDK